MLDPRKSDSVFSIPYSSMVFMDVIPTGFQDMEFGALICPVKDLRVRVSDVDTDSLLLREKFHNFESHPGMDCCCFVFFPLQRSLFSLVVELCLFHF